MKDFKLTILNEEWSIKFVNEHHSSLDGESMGKCEYRTNTIYVSREKPKDTQKHIILHELTHAMLQQSTFNNKIADYLDDYYENFVDIFARCLFDVIKIDIDKLVK